MIYQSNKIILPLQIFKGGEGKKFPRRGISPPCPSPLKETLQILLGCPIFPELLKCAIRMFKAVCEFFKNDKIVVNFVGHVLLM